VTTALPATARGRRTRDALLRAAREVFEAKGFPATRMTDLAEAAGVSHGTVYLYFDSKEAVLREVVTALVGEVYVALRVGDDAGADPVARIDVANRRYLDAYARNARMLAVVEQAATTEPLYRELLADLRRAHVERAQHSLERLQAEGLAATDLDPATTAAALCGMVESFARHWHGRGETYDATTAARTLTALWARAVGLSTDSTDSTASTGG
jgi:AcrR family transcriptional regulator